jgi:hypothetical protein
MYVGIEYVLPYLSGVTPWHRLRVLRLRLKKKQGIVFQNISYYSQVYYILIIEFIVFLFKNNNF